VFLLRGAVWWPGTGPLRNGSEAPNAVRTEAARGDKAHPHPLFAGVRREPFDYLRWVLKVGVHHAEPKRTGGAALLVLVA
jgi:hypothetical protein